MTLLAPASQRVAEIKQRSPLGSHLSNAPAPRNIRVTLFDMYADNPDAWNESLRQGIRLAFRILDLWTKIRSSRRAPRHRKR